MTHRLSPLSALLVVCGTIHAQTSPQPDLFAPDHVADIQITIAKRDWNRLRMQTRTFDSALSANRKQGEFDKPYSYFEADVVIDGVAFERIGLRKKGFIGSLSTTRPSLKIKLNHTDKDASLQGLSNLTLNNNKQDRSLVSQYLSYKIFHAAGSPAPRCGFAHVTVNGKDLGVYAHVERIRRGFLQRNFSSAKGVLYEGTVVDFFPGWKLAFEHKMGNHSRGLQQIEELTKVLSKTGDDKLLAKVGRLVDLDAFFRFWAIEGLLGFWDGYSGNKNNYFCYLHPKTKKFHFLPWGADMLFMKYSQVDDDYEVPLSVKTNGLLAYRLYQLEAGRRRYGQTLKKLLKEHWNEQELYQELDRLEALLEPHLGPSQRRAVDAMDVIRDFITERRSDLTAEIKDGMPVWSKKPKPPFAMPTGEDSWGPSIWRAARDGDIEALKVHVRAGADVNSVSEEDGSHPLALAAVAGRLEAVRYLLKQGAKVNATDDDGDTALHQAAFFGHLEIVETLVDTGAKIDSTSKSGATPFKNASAPWSRDIAGTISFVGKLLGIEYDLDEIRANRPKVATLLRDLEAKRKR